MADGRATSNRVRCAYCGDLGWTVEKYGRVTHKESCPYRNAPWSQTCPSVYPGEKGPEDA